MQSLFLFYLFCVEKTELDKFRMRAHEAQCF